MQRGTTPKSPRHKGTNQQGDRTRSVHERVHATYNEVHMQSKVVRMHHANVSMLCGYLGYIVQRVCTSMNNC